MSEYLAPGVYIEEIPSGNKPIEAAGTSTAGMVGMTARGPVNQPTLVTSQGGFSRVFGGLLNPQKFTDGRDALPYAAEGFFTNGGSRLYVVRIVGDDAVESTLDLEARDTLINATPQLAAAAIVAGDAAVKKLALTGLGAVTEGTRLLIADDAESEVVEVSADSFEPRLQLMRGLRQKFLAGDAVIVQTSGTIIKEVTQDAAAGDLELVVEDVNDLEIGDALLIGEGDELELAEIQRIEGETLTLVWPLREKHKDGTKIAVPINSTDSNASSSLTADVNSGGARALLDIGGAEVNAGAVVQIVSAADADTTEYAQVANIAQIVTLQKPLINSHPLGAKLVPVPAKSVLKVHARYPGVWGNSLRVILRPANLVSTTVKKPAGTNDVSVELASAFGLYRGSVVTISEQLETDGIAKQINMEVEEVNTTTGVVKFTTQLSEALTLGMRVVSQEFHLSVERIENGKAVESETFESLSLAPQHPSYVLKIIGSWDADAQTPSSSGGSNLIRLEYTGDDTSRSLPLITDVGRFLIGGDDDIEGIKEESYSGKASENPNQRTGIFAMENEPAVSIVAVPGQTSVTVQKALVAHCEHMRYRFAVLDTPIGADLAAARAHRQNFDSTRCAIYYPSFERADSFGAPGDRRVISPSGHILGIYARTDTTRGVHKAPANEVVRGILAFDNKLDKGAQDILNPINLNCFRDFRSENRGLRVYGARVATSDPEFKYISVRRLLLMIAQSFDTGLQWAVFEPNDKMLWDTVKQSVTGFLTTIWRSGALQGQKAEEAFYVNIGYNVTMTQDDIDNGRLIVEIGVAPVKPAEFVIVKISQKTREAQD